MDLAAHITACSFASFVAVLLADFVVTFPHDDQFTRVVLWRDMSAATRAGIVWC